MKDQWKENLQCPTCGKAGMSERAPVVMVYVEKIAPPPPLPLFAEPPDVLSLHRTNLSNERTLGCERR
jgi:hypothetical protein